MAIDIFFVEKGDLGEEEEVRTVFESTLHDVLTRRSSTEPLIRERIRNLDRITPFSHDDKLGATIAPNVDVYQDDVVRRTIIEVRAADRPGLLYLIAKNISACGLDIAFARIATEHGVATDVFHVEDTAGNETDSTTRYVDLRERLGQALTQGSYQVEV